MRFKPKTLLPPEGLMLFLVGLTPLYRVNTFAAYYRLLRAYSAKGNPHSTLATPDPRIMVE